MRLNVAADDSPERPDELVDLSGVGTSDRVGNSDSVDTNLVDGPVKVEQVDEVGSERVFRRESDLDSLGLDVLDDCWQSREQTSELASGAVKGWDGAGGYAPSRAVFSM